MQRGPHLNLKPGQSGKCQWQLEDTDGMPIARVGVELTSQNGRSDGTIYLDFLTWDGEPNVIFRRPVNGGNMWKRAWVKGVEIENPYGSEAFRVVQNLGTGLLIQGTRQWQNYSVSAAIVPHLVQSFGVAARVQGMERYYGLLLCDDAHARIVKALHNETVLAEIEYSWKPEMEYNFQLRVHGEHLLASINDQKLFDIQDKNQPLTCGGIALVCTQGRIATEQVSVRPIAAQSA